MEQSGIYSITLIENIPALNFVYPELDNEKLINEITGIVTSYDIDYCLKPDYKNERLTGKNYSFNNIYSVFFRYEDLSIATINFILSLKQSLYGFLAKITFNNNSIKVIPVPLFLSNEPNLNSQQGNSFNLELTSRVPTPLELIEFQNPDLKDWILDTGFWDDDGIWKDTSVWID